MLVFRIENTVGYGPYLTYHQMGECEYNENPPKINLSSIHSRYNEHPGPHYDGIVDMLDDEHCGFSSLDSLIKWFDGYVEKLEEDGYFVTIFEIESSLVRFGGHQVVFLREKSQIVDSFNPNWKRNEKVQRND